MNFPPNLVHPEVLGHFSAHTWALPIPFSITDTLPISLPSSSGSNLTTSPRLFYLFPRAVDSITCVHEYFLHLLNSTSLIDMSPMKLFGRDTMMKATEAGTSPSNNKNNITNACTKGAVSQLSDLRLVQVGLNFQWSSRPWDHIVLLPEKPGRLPFSWWPIFSYKQQIVFLPFIVSQCSSFSSLETLSHVPSLWGQGLPFLSQVTICPPSFLIS